MNKYVSWILGLSITLTISSNDVYAFELIKKIGGNISPKSIVHSGNGLFFAQNMMYRHSITVYNRSYQRVKTISDQVRLSDFGVRGYAGEHRGAPVEAAFSHAGKYAWISNYNMYGPGFNNPGRDKCTPKAKSDHSFLYRVDTRSLTIDRVIKVGSVPKYVAVTPDNRYVLVTNWCSWTLTIIDSQTERIVKTIFLGRYPRGIAVSPDSKTAYVAVMGSFKIAIVDLETWKVSWIRDVGISPRHLNIDPEGRYLYATLNGESTVAKIDLSDHRVLKKVSTGKAPRSMTISDGGKYLYVVNYFSDSVSKIRASDMHILATRPTGHHPIGITYDPETRQVWVACYSALIMVFQD